MISIYRKTVVTLAGMLFVSFGITKTASAFSLTPQYSSLDFRVKSSAGLGAGEVFVEDVDLDNQFGTINLLNGSVSALATSNGHSILTTAEGTSEWTNSSEGLVNLFNIGWNIDGRVPGTTSASANWLYSFTAHEDGIFVLDFEITGFGTSLIGTFGLNGWILEWSGFEPNENVGYDPDENPDARPDYPISGTITRTVQSGVTYTVRLRDRGANVASTSLLSGITQRSGIFKWKVVEATEPVPVPESSSALGLLAFSALGASSVRRVTKS
ncbi:MAG: hypothetical protein RIB93_12840 [Coleofasciculus sp. D1-CHI-01]|uniref:hypothetical protein n=1 Tax=unclassified Coleofasciculus TaxID=2692782 RepID=UPI0033055515